MTKLVSKLQNLKLETLLAQLPFLSRRSVLHGKISSDRSLRVEGVNFHTYYM